MTRVQLTFFILLLPIKKTRLDGRVRNAKGRTRRPFAKSGAHEGPTTEMLLKNSGSGQSKPAG